MQKLKILKRISIEGSIKNKGDVVVVGNNIAHGFIESGMAKLFTGSNKMMRPRKRKGYRIK